MKPSFEFELRFLEVPLEDLIPALRSKGAVQVFSGQVESMVYKQPSLPGSWLRIRKENGTMMATMKKRLDDETFREDSFEVRNLTSTQKVYEEKGWRLARQTSKHRASYILNDIRYDFDIFAMLPPYLEIEGPSKKAVHDGAAMLGLDPAKAFTGDSIFSYYRLGNARLIK